MGIKQKIDQDLKVAMLAGDKFKVSALRGLKSSILYAEVAAGNREEGLPEPEIVNVLGKEAKKRQESADLYSQGGNQEKAEAELKEKNIIEQYLPEQISDEDLELLVDDVINTLGAPTIQQMGQVISGVKAKAGATADGARIAQLVKEKLSGS